MAQATRVQKQYHQLTIKTARVEEKKPCCLNQETKKQKKSLFFFLLLLLLYLQPLQQIIH